MIDSVVVDNDEDVEAWYRQLQTKPFISATKPASVDKFNVFAFEFFDTKHERLGWYRFSCQHFVDPAWPSLGPAAPGDSELARRL